MTNPRHALFILTAFSYFSIFVFVHYFGFSANLADLTPRVLLVVISTFLLSVYCHLRGLKQLQYAVECVGCGILMIVPTVMATYIAARFNLPLADEELAQLDAALGFDWVSFINCVEHNAFLGHLFNLAYQSFGYQLAVWPVVLISLKKEDRAYRMIVVNAIICFISSFISIYLPALGTYAHYQFDATRLQAINPQFGYLFLDQFYAVRNDPHFKWELGNSLGIVTFPSVHAAVALLCTWAMWPSKALRYPVAALNIAMLISTIPNGSHYLVDVLAGILTSSAAIAFISLLTVQRRPTHLASAAARLQKTA